jgi:hypothetical protein
VLRRADYLALTLSLTEATRGLIGPRELGLLKPSAILVNVARPDLVDEEALYGALAMEGSRAPRSTSGTAIRSTQSPRRPAAVRFTSCRTSS